MIDYLFTCKGHWFVKGGELGKANRWGGVRSLTAYPVQCAVHMQGPVRDEW